MEELTAVSYPIGRRTRRLRLPTLLQRRLPQRRSSACQITFPKDRSRIGSPYQAYQEATESQGEFHPLPFSIELDPQVLIVEYRVWCGMVGRSRTTDEEARSGRTFRSRDLRL
jgi:hypothetical protein